MPEAGERVKQEWEVTSGKLHDEGATLTAGARFHPTFRQVEGGSLENKARPVPGTGTATTHTVGADIGLRTLDWGSEVALKRALDAGLDVDDFTDREPSGKTGYLLSDVEALLEGGG